MALQRTARDLLAAFPPPAPTSAEPGRDAVTSGVTMQYLQRGRRRPVAQATVTDAPV
ncbi:MAG TPA: hypothetical protein VGJ43_12670 [Acidimicrobiales bacterium]